MREEVSIFMNINFLGYHPVLVDIILDDSCGSGVRMIS